MNITQLARGCIDRLEDELEYFTKAEVVELLVSGGVEFKGELLTTDSITLNMAVHNALRDMCVCMWDGQDAYWFGKNSLSPEQISAAVKQHRGWGGVISGGITDRCDEMADIAIKVAQGMTYKAAEQLVRKERG